MSRHIWFSWLMISIAGIAACGGDDDDAGGAVAGKAASGSGGANAAASGGRASQGSGGRAGSSTSGTAGSMAGPVQCGSTTCAAQAGGFTAVFATACCVDAATGTCGMSLMGAACAAPSQGDARCPTVQAFGGISIPSCCTTDGKCGLDASMFGFGGCTELGAAAQQAGAMGMGMGGMIPAPRACDDTGSDAGVSDAGA